jgi:UDP-glucose 4-epimerase
MNHLSKILVTGAAGFMGSHLVDALVQKKYRVYGIDDLSGGYTRNINLKSIFYKVDLRDKKKTATYITKIKPEIIFHLAADATEGRSQFTPIGCTERNYLAYLSLLVPAIRSGLKKIVVTSSMSVYGSQKSPFQENMERKPVDIYGVSKSSMEAATEIMSNTYGFSYTIIRPHNVYGPRQNMADPYRNVIAIFINRLLANKHFYIYGDGQQKRAFTYIDDFTPYIIQACFQKNCDKQIINLGPSKEYTINQLSKIILDTFFPKTKIPKHLFPVHLPDRPQEVKNAWCTIEKAEKLLKYKEKTTLTEGIKNMIDWAKKLGKQEFVYLKELEIISEKTPVTWKKKLI